MGAHPGLHHRDSGQELPLRNDCLAAENRILKAQLKGHLRFSDTERAKLGEIGRRLGRKALGEVANAALPDTILACTEGWSRASSTARKYVGCQAGLGSTEKSRS